MVERTGILLNDGTVIVTAAPLRLGPSPRRERAVAGKFILTEEELQSLRWK